MKLLMTDRPVSAALPQDAAAVDVVDDGKAPGPDEGEEHGQQIQKRLPHPHTPQKSRVSPRAKAVPRATETPVSKASAILLMPATMSPAMTSRMAFVKMMPGTRAIRAPIMIFSTV